MAIEDRDHGLTQNHVRKPLRQVQSRPEALQTTALPPATPLESVATGGPGYSLDHSQPGPSLSAPNAGMRHCTEVQAVDRDLLEARARAAGFSAGPGAWASMGQQRGRARPSRHSPGPEASSCILRSVYRWVMPPSVECRRKPSMEAAGSPGTRSPPSRRRRRRETRGSPKVQHPIRYNDLIFYGSTQRVSPVVRPRREMRYGRRVGSGPRRACA